MDPGATKSAASEELPLTTRAPAFPASAAASTSDDAVPDEEMEDYAVKPTDMMLIATRCEEEYFNMEKTLQRSRTELEAVALARQTEAEVAAKIPQPVYVPPKEPVPKSTARELVDDEVYCP